VNLFGEGYNVPAVECVQLARPTQSLCFHKQSIGRATRVHAGKRYPIVLDHAGNMLRHGRITRHIDYDLATGAIGAAAGSGLRLCPKCYRLNDSGRGRCLDCGYVFGSEPRERELPRSIDGELQEYQDDDGQAKPPKPTPAERQSYFDALASEAELKGWKPGAVAYRMKERFGEWPTVLTIEGRPHLVHEEADDTVKRAAYAAWAQQAADKGYKSGFAFARFKGAFGHSPSREHRAGVPANPADLYTAGVA
jgi:hypothetical protein